MNRVPLKNIRLQPSPSSGWVPKVHLVLFALFLIQWALVWAGLWLPRPAFGAARWPEGLLLVLTTATLLASLARRLPGQNVVLASVGIAVLGAGVETLGVLTGVPFGPFIYNAAMGQKLFDVSPWSAPMIWIAVLLAGRGVARFVLRPWRKSPNYGYWLLGLTALLVLVLDLGLEPYATQVRGLWTWTPTRLSLEWYTAPLVNFVGWGAVAIVILAFITPALINKNPIQQPPPDCHPLAVWLLLELLFATGAAVKHLWLAVAVTAAANVVVVGFALRGALRQETE